MTSFGVIFSRPIRTTSIIFRPLVRDRIDAGRTIQFRYEYVTALHSELFQDLGWVTALPALITGRGLAQLDFSSKEPVNITSTKF